MNLINFKLEYVFFVFNYIYVVNIIVVMKNIMCKE